MHRFAMSMRRPSGLTVTCAHGTSGNSALRKSGARNSSYPAMSLSWVRLSKYCVESGETPDAVEKRLRTGKWLRDVHARRPDGSAELWVNLRAVEDWAAGKLPAHQHGAK